ncbi:MAG TPA: transcription antitermination factor NusB [Tepidisphaeraceae bacterium]|jgi:16S rRNA (cytosine967-C5)-methyltransferase
MNGRDWALEQLLAAKLPGWDDLESPGFKGPIDPRDTALGNAIAATVTQNLLLIRHLIKHYSGRELQTIEPMIQLVVAIGLAQLRFFTRVPPSAAVDQAVEQIRRVGLARAAGFVNAILRRATREPTPPLPGEDNPQQFAHIVLSHPPHVYKKLAHLYGPARAIELCRMHNAEPPTILRLINDATVEQLIARVEKRSDPSRPIHAGAGAPDLGLPPRREAHENDASHETPARGLRFISHEVPGLVVVQNAVEHDFATWANAGLAQVQDPTAAKVIQHVDAFEGARILDRCCGVGTKTLQLAERVGLSGEVVATDPAKERISRLATSARHRKLPQVKPVVAGMMADLGEEQLFDRVLIDAPCSNSGVLARRLEARYHQDARTLHSLRDLQRRIIADTLPAVRPGGLLIYSTCSIWPEENGDQVAWIIKQNESFEVADVQSTAPSTDPNPANYHDGGYIAVLRRKA